MAPKRTIVVVVAVAVGVLAAVLSYVFLHNAQSNAYKNAKLEPAYVVAKQIPRGLSGSDAVSGGYFTKKSIPVEVRPTSAMTDLTQLQGKLAAATFSQGQVLVAGMFVSPSQAAVSFSHLIKPGDVAITISVDQVHGVADLPVPGDQVDLLVNVNGAENVMLQNVPILAVGQTTSGQGTATQAQSTTPTTTNSSGLYTFEVRPSDATRIALAQQQGLDIYMVLVPPGNQVTAIPGSGVSTVLNGPQASG